MGGGHQDFKVPDWRQYTVENIPELMATKRALAGKGLSDPWLRNEAWRYNVKEFGNEKIRAKRLFLRGFRYGFPAFVATVVGTAIYDKMYPSDHGHGHEEHSDHGHGHEEH